jgi:hypothetical protein
MFPLNFIEGVHVDFERLPGWVIPSSLRDYEQLVDRFNKFPQQADQVIGMMKAAVKEGRTEHEISLVIPSSGCAGVLYSKMYYIVRV